MNYQEQYAAFVAKVLGDFHELKDPDWRTLARYAERFRQVRAAFLAGDPLEDAGLQEETAVFYKVARHISSDLMLSVDRGLSVLGEIALSRATVARHKGKEGCGALVARHQYVVEVRSADLPKEWRANAS